MPNQAPLGVFDSGLGGLTVVRALRQICPNEDIVYLGDTARVPYGTRSAQTVTRYALGCARLLEARGVKAIIVACNTVSSVALDSLAEKMSLPVIGVILPGANAAVRAVSQGTIGVLATAGTIHSGAYPKAIAKLTADVHVIGQAAPLLVGLAEEGWTEGEVPHLVVRRYIQPLIESGAQGIVLGCTHFPLLKNVIAQEAQALSGQLVRVVDGALATADHVRRFLQDRNSNASFDSTGTLSMMVTDIPKGFDAVASRFLGESVSNAEQIDL